MNPNVEALSGSLIREIAAKKKPDSIDLGLGEPSLPPTIRYFYAAVSSVEKDGMRYTVNAGDLQLRELIAGHYAYPHAHSAENVCVTTGSQEAVYVAIKTLMDPAKDEMLLVEPTFPAYKKMALLEGVVVRTVSMTQENDFAFDAQRILEAVTGRTRLIVICSPCNPTGRVLSSATVSEIAAGLSDRGREPVYVLHDEIYREQTYIPDAGYFAQTYPYTIVTNSLSKSNAITGLRVGWTLAPKPLATSIVKTHAWVTSCASTYAQSVARHIFSTPGALQEHAAWYRQRLTAVIDELQETGLRFIVPQGTFYACVALGERRSSLAAAHELADEDDVIAIPGIAFGASFENWLRLTWVAPLEQVREGIHRIARRYAPSSCGSR
ncbi:MAG: pyridoxal phosphate-dependent aminotransferase [Candidatus Eremiobacteraeota bacterium]|nr:pyridoxal phosphate-dependent aminotransferase [Candidatus Eremiobacteraeota bacterium]